MLQEATFQDWLDQQYPILRISRRPGAAKSHLSAKIIEHLSTLTPEACQSNLKPTVAYFFCMEDDLDKRFYKTVIATLVYQIVQLDETYARYIAGVCEIAPAEKQRPMLWYWKVLFMDYFLSSQMRSNVILVVDGLDEALPEWRREFLMLISDLLNQGYSRPLRLQLLMIGRSDLDWELERSFNLVLPRIGTSTNRVNPDIDHYIVARIKKTRSLNPPRISHNLRQDIRERLSKAADGMFLWVNLMIEELTMEDHINQENARHLRQIPGGP